MSTITLTSSQLKTLVAPLLPIARLGGEHAPIYGGIRMEAFGDELVLSVTDRFRLGLTRHKLPEPSEFKATLDHADIRRILAVLKPTRDTDPLLELRTDDDRIHVTHAGGLFDALAMTFRQVEGVRPDLYKLLLQKLATEPAAAVTSVNPTYLAQFADARRSHSDAMDIRVCAGKEPVIVVHVGDHFVGVVMPMRRGTHAEPVDWTAILSPAKAVAS